MAVQSTKKIIGGSGGSQYDRQAHKGLGKSQKLLPPAVGAKPNSPTPHANGAIVRDGTEGHAGPKRGYQMDAHSPTHHGRNGEAIGHKSDLRPMDYDHQLYGEGSNLPHVGVKTNAKHGAATARAEHHPAPTGQPHRFREGSANAAHGYGHAPAQREGVFRNSGHARAHQVGKR